MVSYDGADLLRPGHLGAAAPELQDEMLVFAPSRAFTFKEKEASCLQGWFQGQKQSQQTRSMQGFSKFPRTERKVAVHTKVRCRGSCPPASQRLRGGSRGIEVMLG